MNKPKSPKKPSKRDPVPSIIILINKILIFDIKNKKYQLIDQRSHPICYKDPYKDNSTDIELSDEPYWEQLEELGYEWNNERLSYYNYKQIANDCNLLDDFIIIHKYNQDGYYDYSYIEYKIEDPDYDKKFKIYENRYTIYEEERKKYEVELSKYNEFLKEKKKQNLKEKLKQLENK